MVSRRRGVSCPVRLSFRERPDCEVRCALCHDVLTQKELACARCHILFHDECYASVRRCPTLGCGSTRASSTAPRPSRLRHLRGMLLTSTVAIAITGWLAIPPCADNGCPGSAKAQISCLETAIENYKQDTGRLPETLQDLRDDHRGVGKWQGPYLKKDLPPDPWGNDYVYATRATKRGADYLLASCGLTGDTAPTTTSSTTGAVDQSFRAFRGSSTDRT